MNLITEIEKYSFYNREDKALVMKHENEAIVINSAADIPKDVREKLNLISVSTSAVSSRGADREHAGAVVGCQVRSSATARCRLAPEGGTASMAAH